MEALNSVPRSGPESNRTVSMKLAGGNLTLHWNAEDNHVYQTGPAEFVFEGEWIE